MLDLVRVQSHGLLSFNSLQELDVLDQTLANRLPALIPATNSANLSKV